MFVSRMKGGALKENGDRGYSEVHQVVMRHFGQCQPLAAGMESIPSSVVEKVLRA